MPDRIAVLAAVTDLIILRRRPGGVLRVGIDGVDGSGKSVLGDELASMLRARGLTVVRASGDGFHRPASERYRRGRRSPHGYYECEMAVRERWLRRVFTMGSGHRVGGLTGLTRVVTVMMNVMPATSEEPSFAEFVTARSPALHRAAWLLTGDPQHAEDLVQAALVRVWPKWARITKDGRDGEAYVRAVLYTTYVSWWRRRSWHERPREDRASQPATPDVADSVVMRTALTGALDGLPRMQRASLVLRYYEDLTIVQAADVLGVSTGTVTTHIARGLAALRQDGALEGMGGGRRG